MRNRPSRTGPGFDGREHPSLRQDGCSSCCFWCIAFPVAEAAKMGDARCLLCFLTTIATCYVFSSAVGSGVRIRRSTPWRVTTIEDFPYSRSKVERPTKNEDWEGYIPDLLRKIGEYLHQPYTITAVADGRYGIKDPTTNRWNGMIGEIVDKKADVAAAAITVSDARKVAVDFTTPLMDIGSVILLLKPSDGSAIRINSAKDLADQTAIKYGVVKDGTTIQLIHNSSLPYYRKISAALNADPQRQIGTSQEGVRRVRSEGGKFAFITESATGEYWANQRPCDLVQIAIDLPATEYAFAVALGSPIEAEINRALAHLRENGELEKSRSRWWKEECSRAGRHFWGALVGLPLLALVKFVATSVELN